MSAPLPSMTPVSDVPLSKVAFGVSADGFLVAQVGDVAFAMLPAGNGRHYIASASGLKCPLDQARTKHFRSHHGPIQDEAAFWRRMREEAEHRRELKALARRSEPTDLYTPWGPSQCATVYADGVVYHAAESHGGFLLSEDRNALVHQSVRSGDGWYEEDCAWAIVAITFPQLFTGSERRRAERTIKDIWPDAWEDIFGTILGPGESREKDRRSFEAEHADSWIVISAIRSCQHEGFVECLATPEGRRGPGTGECRFLVPSNEYASGRFGFVIDPDRHAVYGGPSSFPGWAS